MNKVQDFPSVKEFTTTLGPQIARYFGKDPACILYLKPDGSFYAEGLSQWLTTKKKKTNVTVSAMEDGGEDIDEAKVKGCKILIVDNDVVTGKGYKRSMEALRMRKQRLKIKDIKFATYFDRIGVTDFSVSKYASEAIWHLDDMDAVDLKIIEALVEDGRESLSSIAKGTVLSSVAVGNRIQRLLKEKILTVRGLLHIDQFYTMSAHILIEADSDAVEKLVESFEPLQEVFHFTKTSSGRYNLVVGILARDIGNVENFIEQEVRAIPGVKRLDVFFGELPSRPKYFFPRRFS